MNSQTIILVPKVVAQKAKSLVSVGCHKAALKLLEDNRVEFDVYDSHMTVKMGRPNPIQRPKREYHFHKKRN